MLSLLGKTKLEVQNLEESIFQFLQNKPNETEYIALEILSSPSNMNYVILFLLTIPLLE
jgi:hypothetical protein